MKKVAVVGGGISGLAAAFTHLQRGWDVTLFESSRRVGGPIETITRDGFVVECGPSTLLDVSADIRQFLGDLGLASEILTTRPEAKNKYLLCNGAPVSVPKSPIGFLSTPLFSWRSKLALLREPFIGPRNDDADESLGDFVRRRLGAEYLGRAIDALVGGIYAGDPEQLSVRYAFPALYETEKTYGSLIRGQVLGARARKLKKVKSRQTAAKLSLTRGLGSIPARIADLLDSRLRLNHRVYELSLKAATWHLRGKVDERPFEDEFDAVVLAVPAHVLASIRLEVDNKVIDTSFSKKIPYPPIASVALGFRRDDVRHPLDGFGILVPGREKRFVLGTIFSSTLFDGRAPNGHVLLSSYVGGARNPSHPSLAESTIIERTAADLQQMLSISAPPTFAAITIYPRSIPQYNVGHGEFLKRFNAIEEQSRNLKILGNFRHGVSLADSLLSGLTPAPWLGAI